jgi:8-oxo-dGTP diphosphatase
MPRDPRIGVGTAVIVLNENKEMLLLKRKGSHAADCWAVPGGWVDFEDDTLLHAAARELKEELGLVVDTSKKVFGPKMAYEKHEDFSSVTLYFLIPWGAWSGTPEILEPNKCSELQWHPVQAPPPTPHFPNLDKAVIDVRREYDLYELVLSCHAEGV